MRIRRLLSPAGAALLGLACASNPASTVHTPPDKNNPLPVSALQGELRRMKPARLLPAPDSQKQLDAAIDSYFQRAGTRRAYLMVDKPLYQPGETIWLRADLRQTASLTAYPSDLGVTMQLVSPKGAVVLQQRILVHDGVAAGDFDLPEDVQGGEYILRLQGDDGTADERPVIVSTYEAPRLKKTLEFLRKAYGPGDSVSAAVEVTRATGEPYALGKLTALVVLDDAELARVPVSTDPQGKAIVRFTLPESIARGDALLTVLADDGGVTESIQKRVPIVMKSIGFSMFPEGGDLVAGLPGRVYFSAENSIGKPADVEGTVKDDTGAVVATFVSVRDGMGRFDLTPQRGRRYLVAIDKPVGITQTFDVPAAQPEGCALQSVDDFDSADDAVKIAAFCTRAQTVLVEAVLREKRIGSGALDVGARQPQVVAFPADRGLQGAVRVTLFDEKHQPLAERLVYRGRGQDLKIDLKADKPSYSPRDPVTLSVKTTDLAGKPVPASVGLSIADDTVLSFADDKTAHIKAHLYLEAELGAVELEDPNFYFGAKPEAAAALDMVMGTKGYRRFDWQLVLTPPAPQYPVSATGALEGGFAEEPMAGAPVPDMAPPPPMARAEGRKGQAPMKKPADALRPVMAPPANPAPKQEQAQDRAARRPNREFDAKLKRADDAHGAGARAGMDKDEEWGGEDGNIGWNFAPVRVFPAPTYQAGYDGPRTDFRETIFWAPDVRTDKDGTARVTFYTSDAVTSFRVTAEGASAGGLPGRGEAVIKNKMPLALDARLPLEVSAGDKIELPVTLANETDRDLTADLDARFGAAFALKNGIKGQQRITLRAGEKRAFFFPIEVVSKAGGEGEVKIAVATAGLKDEIHKKIKVVALGFPFEVSFAGTAKKGVARHTVELGGALPGTLVASVKMYPSPLASMTTGAEAILREPGGCFEQTSSSNYPNVMVLQYLEKNEAASPEIIQRSQGMLSRGYKILAGYETKEKGYEWFGETPGHEALTAYGLMEFQDMAEVDDEVDRAMIERTATWLMSRRDGKGGYQRNSRALDSFGRASYETTNGYITWALTEAKRSKDLKAEIDAQRKAGLDAKDPYLVALAANTMLNVDAAGADTAAIVKRLAAMQDKAGHLPGAKESITMSGGESLDIETASLAAIAFMKASPGGEYEAQVRGAIEWLNGKRDGWGAFGSTQGTVLSLKALTRYADYSARTQASGEATVIVNGKDVGKIVFEKGRKEALSFADLGPALVAGKNVIEIKLDGDASLPYSVAIEYRAAKPQSSAMAKIGVSTKLARDTVKLGEGIRMHADIVNQSQDGVPMTLARVGIPGGLTFQTWQLKELKDKGLIDFYETHEREVVLYFRAMAPAAKKSIDLDLMATVPGTYIAPATSAYLYYTDEHKSWSSPLQVTIR